MRLIISSFLLILLFLSNCDSSSPSGGGGEVTDVETLLNKVQKAVSAAQELTYDGKYYITNGEHPITLEGKCTVVKAPKDEILGYYFLIESADMDVYYNENIFYVANHAQKTVKMGDPVNEPITRVFVKNGSAQKMILLSEELISGKLYNNAKNGGISAKSMSFEYDAPNRQYILTYLKHDRKDVQHYNATRKVYIDDATFLPKMVHEDWLKYKVPNNSATTILNLKQRADKSKFNSKKNPPENYNITFFSR